VARNLFLSFCLLFLLLPVCAYAVDVEKDLSLQLRENRKLVLAAEEKLGAGLSPASEIARLKASSDNVRAIFLLLQERYKLRQEKAASVSAKASERHERVADGVLKALEEYLGLVENIPPDTVSPSALKTLKSLIDSIIRSRRAPLLGTLPYKHLGYPTREPATSPIITPAYRRYCCLYGGPDFKRNHHICRIPSVEPCPYLRMGEEQCRDRVVLGSNEGGRRDVAAEKRE